MSGMRRSWQRWGWKLCSGSWLVIGGVIPFGIATLHASSGDCALAQITPDDTLPNNSIVTPSGNTSVIEGGTQKGSNLFHSFDEFSVPTGGAAYFNNALDIQNIISRVTGSTISNIDGLIRANASANLFLLNPNGIIFGPNASLNIGGSILASTASAINFADGKQFSATAPQTTPLLRVSVPLGLQYGSNAGSVQVHGSVLQVQTGQTLALLGGDVSVEGGKSGFLSALGGQIELGGVAGAGTVDIEGQQSQEAFRLTALRFPDSVERADVLLTNSAYVYVAGGGGGSIAINALNLDILGESTLFAGIAPEQESVTSQAGDITLNTTGKITVAGSSSIFNSVDSGAVGNGGDINIQAGSLSLTNGAQLSSSTSGQGDAGSVSVQADDSVSVTNSDIFSVVEEEAVGKGGDINIQAGSFSLDNNALMLTSTLGVGDAGSVSVQVVDSVSLANGSIDSSVLTEEAVGNGGVINIQAGSLSLSDDAGLSTTTFGRGDAGGVSVQAVNSVSIANSSIDSSVYSGAVGKGGNINIQARSLSLSDNAGLSTRTIGQGDAGSVLIQASESVSLVNSDISSENLGDIFAEGEVAVGNGGDINILTGSLSLTDNAGLDTSTYGQGDAGSVLIQARDSVSLINSDVSSLNAGDIITEGEAAVGKGGNINIQASSLSLSDNAQIATSTYGQGDAGSVSVQVDGSVSLANSFINSELVPEAVGKGGNIDIKARSLSLTDNAELNTSTSGQGDAGSVLIQASDSVSLVNSDISSANYGDILAEGEVAVGKGGDINILTGTLSFDKAFLSTGTLGLGDAGSVIIRASGPVSFTSESTILSAVTGSAFLEIVRPEAVGKGGNINIQAESLFLADETALITATSGQGNAGGIFVQTNDFVSITGDSLITSAVERGGVGNSGDIDIQTRSLSLTGGSQLRAAVENELNNLPGGRGEGGNIRINATETVNLSGVSSNGHSSGLLTITEQGASGQAGDITVNTGGLSIADGAVVSAQTLNFSDGGTITINANTFEAANGGQVLTTTYDIGKAGNITVNAPDSVTLSGRAPTFAARVAQFGGANNQGSASGLFAGTQSAGTAGNLKIQTGQLIVRDGAQVSASTASTGTGGTLEVTAPTGSVELIGSSSGLFAQSAATGSAGNLTITTGQLQVLDGAEVTVSGESGIAGNLTATANSIRLDQGKLTAVTGKGSGGNIGLSMQDLLLMRDNSLISAEALGTANGGNINIDTDFIVAIPSENSDISANAEEARGGRVIIDAQGIFGTEFRERENPATSDITASSNLGSQFSGTVEINTPDVDPAGGLVNLPAVPIDTEVVQACTPGGSAQQSEFIITGRGGLPSNPGDALSTDAVQVDLITLNPEVKQPSTPAASTSPTSPAPPPIVEAQGWVIDANGNVVLIANAPTVTPHIPWLPSTDCHAPESSS